MEFYVRNSRPGREYSPTSFLDSNGNTGDILHFLEIREMSGIFSILANLYRGLYKVLLVSSELPNEVLADNIRTFELESTNVKATNLIFTTGGKVGAYNVSQ